MPEKPSRNEEEYFAKEEAEKLKKQRAAMAAAESGAERKSHFMKCPKCGAGLVTETFHGVQIDRCSECNGIWLDPGEIDTIMSHEDKGLLSRVFSDMLGSLRRGGNR
ncbi:MAG: zf-TFIIB domain-containing protein [Gemmatimonadota bacterium]